MILDPIDTPHRAVAAALADIAGGGPAYRAAHASDEIRRLHETGAHDLLDRLAGMGWVVTRADAAVAQALRWTDAPPSRDGWYWRRPLMASGSAKDPSITEVYPHPDDGFVTLINGARLLVAEMPCLWAGPLTPPTEGGAS